MVSIDDLDIEDVLEGLPIDEKLRASQIMYIHGEDGYTPIKGKDYFDGNDGKDGKDGKDGYTPIKGIDYDDGQDYVLTEDDIKEIASKIEVPIVEKEIETVIIEKPIITNEIKEVAMYELAEDIVKKINSLELEDEYKIDASHIKNLPVFTGGGKRYALNGVPTGGTTGQVLKKRSGANYDLEWGTGGGGSGIVESIVAGTNITVDSTDPANPIVNLDADIAINSVRFDSTPTSITPVAGDVIYNTDEDTLDLVTNNNTYQLGQELSLLYKNQTGFTIPDGTPVVSDGSLGASGRIKITPAIADGTQDPHSFLGITTQSIANGDDGKVTYFGKVRDIDTTGTPYGETWADGDDLWVSETDFGYLTNTMPQAPNYPIFVGKVINAHATNGTIFIKPTFNKKLVDLADVNGTPLTTTGQIPVWDNVSGYFDFTTNINDKLDKNTSILGATKTKITYDTNGLVTGGTDATTADIADSTNRRYVTDAQLTVISNTSGTNTGDQDLSPYFNKSVDDTDDITVGATNKFATAAEKAKLANITVTQAVDLDAIETNSNASKVKTDFITVTQNVDLDTIETNSNASKVKTDFITVTQAVNLDTIESDTATNNAKVTNATHTGEVTGATSLTVDKTAITNKSTVTPVSGDFILISDTSDSGNLKKVDAADFLGGGGGVASVTGTGVDNTDPSNPVVNTPSLLDVTSVGSTAASITTDPGAGSGLRVIGATSNNRVDAGLDGSDNGYIEIYDSTDTLVTRIDQDGINGVQLTSSGPGTNFLADDGTYQPGGGGSSDYNTLSNQPIENYSGDIDTLIVAGRYNLTTSATGTPPASIGTLPYSINLEMYVIRIANGGGAGIDLIGHFMNDFANFYTRISTYDTGTLVLTLGNWEVGGADTIISTSGTKTSVMQVIASNPATAMLQYYFADTATPANDRTIIFDQTTIPDSATRTYGRPANSGTLATLDDIAPGGSTTQVQYNNAGAFAGASNVAIDGDNLKLVSTTDPTAPTGGLILYSKSVAGRHFPKIIGPSGIDTILQAGLHGNAVFMVAPASGTTAPTAWGGTLTTIATMSLQQTIASANPWLATSRKRFATSTAIGNQTGMRTAYAQWFRGNAAGFGGFFFRTQFGHQANINGAQLFMGLCASTGVLAATAGSVSALLNMCGMGYDTTDANTGNWQFYRNDGSGTATKVDLGANAVRSNVSHGYDFIMFMAPNSSDLYVRIVNIHTGVTVLDTSYNTDIPAVNVGMAFKAETNNGAVASSSNIEVAKVYIETDY